jgi:hypothetical protein
MVPGPRGSASTRRNVFVGVGLNWHLDARVLDARVRWRSLWRRQRRARAHRQRRQRAARGWSRDPRHRHTGDRNVRRCCARRNRRRGRARCSSDEHAGVLEVEVHVGLLEVAQAVVPIAASHRDDSQCNARSANRAIQVRETALALVCCACTPVQSGFANDAARRESADVGDCMQLGSFENQQVV